MINKKILKSKVNADRWYVALFETVIGESLEGRGLSHTWRANNDKFEDVIVIFLHIIF